MTGSFWPANIEEGGFLTTSYATHHRHTCIGARAGFGDLLIGAGALMTQANGLDTERHGHIRDAMVELITITEGFFACGVAASVYCTKDPAGSVMPDAVFSNIGKLLLATKIYDMHRLAHYVSGGLIVALPGPDEDHNPETQASLSAVLGGRPDIPAEQRLEVSRLIEDLTVSHQAGWYSVISLHGGGSPEAMKREIWRNYPVMEKVELVENLLDRGVAADGDASPSNRADAARRAAKSPACPFRRARQKIQFRPLRNNRNGWNERATAERAAGVVTAKAASTSFEDRNNRPAHLDQPHIRRR